MEKARTFSLTYNIPLTFSSSRFGAEDSLVVTSGSTLPIGREVVDGDACLGTNDDTTSRNAEAAIKKKA